MATPDCVVFTGPSLPCTEAIAVDKRLVCYPPAIRGDVWRAAQAGARFIALIDGVFYDRAAVSHREIISTIRSDVTVIGGSSMGALRASELDGFGMIGVGKIYRCFKEGSIEADDEVAVGYNPVTFEPVSEPLVNIRFALHMLNEAHRIDRHLRDELLSIAKGQFYLDRRVGTLLKIAERRSVITAQKAHEIEAFLAHKNFDLKRADALEVIKTLVSLRYGH
ncbi:MAG: TfuA-like protein [Halobacteriota archaeon]